MPPVIIGMQTLQACKSTRKSPIDTCDAPIESSLDCLGGTVLPFLILSFQKKLVKPKEKQFTIDLIVQTGPVWSIYLDKRTIWTFLFVQCTNPEILEQSIQFNLLTCRRAYCLGGTVFIFSIWCSENFFASTWWCALLTVEIGSTLWLAKKKRRF